MFYITSISVMVNGLLVHPEYSNAGLQSTVAVQLKRSAGCKVCRLAWRTMHHGRVGCKQCSNGGCSRVVKDEGGGQVLPNRAS